MVPIDDSGRWAGQISSSTNWGEVGTEPSTILNTLPGAYTTGRERSGSSLRSPIDKSTGNSIPFSTLNFYIHLSRLRQVHKGISKITGWPLFTSGGNLEPYLAGGFRLTDLLRPFDLVNPLSDRSFPQPCALIHFFTRHDNSSSDRNLKRQQESFAKWLAKRQES